MTLLLSMFLSAALITGFIYFVKGLLLAFEDQKEYARKLDKWAEDIEKRKKQLKHYKRT